MPFVSGAEVLIVSSSPVADAPGSPKTLTNGIQQFPTNNQQFPIPNLQPTIPNSQSTCFASPKSFFFVMGTGF
jgi:hypothetical protein